MRLRSTTWLGLLWLTPLFGGSLGCGPEAQLVELRLFPCEFDGVDPRSVAVELTGFDANGEVVETFEAGYDDIGASVFDDGYASVGYRKDPSVVEARVRLGWFSTASAGTVAEAEAIVVYEAVEVPALGEIMSLGSDVGDCSELIGDGDGDPTGDGDGDGDGDPSGDGDGDPSGDGDGDPSGDGDGDPSGDGDGDGDGDPSGDGDGDTGEDLPGIGDACDPFNAPFECVPELDGDAGTPLLCSAISMQLEETALWPTACIDLCPADSANPVDACSGFGAPAGCLCQPTQEQDCGLATLGCTGDGHIKLCHAGSVVIGTCNDCAQTPGGYFTCTR